MYTGATREHIKNGIQIAGLGEIVKPHFAVMCGGGAQVTGSLAMDMAYFDGNDPMFGGVDYDNNARGFATRTEASRDLRARLYDSVNEVAGRSIKYLN